MVIQQCVKKKTLFCFEESEGTNFMEVLRKLV